MISSANTKDKKNIPSQNESNNIESKEKETTKIKYLSGYSIHISLEKGDQREVLKKKLEQRGANLHTQPKGKTDFIIVDKDNFYFPNSNWNKIKSSLNLDDKCILLDVSFLNACEEVEDVLGRAKREQYVLNNGYELYQTLKEKEKEKKRQSLSKRRLSLRGNIKNKESKRSRNDKEEEDILEIIPIEVKPNLLYIPLSYRNKTITIELDLTQDSLEDLIDEVKKSFGGKYSLLLSDVFFKPGVYCAHKTFE